MFYKADNDKQIFCATTAHNDVPAVPTLGYAVYSNKQVKARHLACNKETLRVYKKKNSTPRNPPGDSATSRYPMYSSSPKRTDTVKIRRRAESGIK